VIQRLSELDRVHLRTAIDIGSVMLVKVCTGEQERGNLSSVGSEPDFVQVSAHAQVKRPSEDVRGLKAGLCQCHHLLSFAAIGGIEFLREMR